MRLVEFRRTKNLTQAAFGALIGKSQAAVGRYEAFQRYPRPETLSRIKLVTRNKVSGDDFLPPRKRAA